MKKIFLAAACLVIGAQSYAQSLMIGVRGSYNTTWLLNKNIFDRGDIIDHAASFAPDFGIMAQYSFRENLGLAIEINTATLLQKYEGSLKAGTLDIAYKGQDALKYIDIPLVLRVGSESGMYFEIGPKFGFLSAAKGKFDYTPDLTGEYSERNIKAGFNSSAISVVIGFGANIKASDRVNILTGLRLNYVFTDITKEKTKEELIDDAVSSLTGITEQFAHQNQNGDYSYETTTGATGGLIFGVAIKLFGASK